LCLLSVAPLLTGQPAEHFAGDAGGERHAATSFCATLCPIQMGVSDTKWHHAMSSSSRVAAIFESLEYGPAPETATPALEWLAAHGPLLSLFIANEWRAPSEGVHFASVNPATAEPLIEVAQGSTADVEAAVTAARIAFPNWSTTPGHVRARYLYALARQVQKHSRLLAVLETLDNGKPIRETPRHRCPAGRAPLLPLCRLGATP
jgi:hypothetical protein